MKWAELQVLSDNLHKISFFFKIWWDVYKTPGVQHVLILSHSKTTGLFNKQTWRILSLFEVLKSYFNSEQKI